jgi:hypothetical protein
VHELTRAHNGIHRTGLNAFGAADTRCLINPGYARGLGLTMLAIKRFAGSIKPLRQCVDPGLTAWWALIDIRLAIGDGLGIRKAAWVAALLAVAA